MHPEGIDFIKYLLVVDPAESVCSGACFQPLADGRKLGDDLNVGDPVRHPMRLEPNPGDQ